MTLLKIPYGISNFRIMREEGYIYVDKTRYIRVLEDYPAPYQFFLRPRRFGKSLFVSVLNNYYDINEKENFHALFEGTDIGKEPTAKRNSYYVLNFNFSALSTETEEVLYSGFTARIRDSLEYFLNRYELSFSLSPSGSPADLLAGFFSRLPSKMNGKVFVIIDEYDHFANELLSFNLNLFQETISRQGFIRKWYEALKIGTQTFVARIFATGVSPVTLDSLTSGFNISTNLTRNPKLNGMMGFTEQEVTRLIEATVPGEVTRENLPIMRQYYNGYLFSEMGETRVFNSDMILYYLSSIRENGQPPEQLLDMNIASDYGKIGKLLEIKSPMSNIAVLKDIVYKGEVTAQITAQFSMEKEFTRDDFISLLFYLGLLTIKKPIPGEVSLTIPNYVIKGLYFDLFTRFIAQEGSFDLEPARIREAIREIGYEGRCVKLIGLIEDLLHAFSNRDFIGFDEKYIKIAFFTYANMSNLYLVKSEYEVNEGYIDIALLKRDPWHPDYYAIFELKYLKMADSSPERIEQVVQSGQDQLSRYVSSPELSAIPNLKRWVLVFAGDRCVVVDEV
ncbi:ATP-binding protein [Methanospirillum hungatei]|uniref:ATP-binding protein n=1 Tax=Methanospirillum hungatei TaxID=2203 RepID=UPI0026EBA96A|nr:ATP-binding protein [Methanospirillum hungatei]